MDASYEILDAFVDGETVDPVALKRALSDPAGRDYLIDTWMLRGLVQDELATEVAPPNPQLSPSSSPRSWLIAASIAAVCLVGGYAVGARFAGVIVPRPAPAPAESVSAPMLSSSAVPAATRVIRLEMDPNWNERVGGR